MKRKVKQRKDKSTDDPPSALCILIFPGAFTQSVINSKLMSNETWCISTGSGNIHTHTHIYTHIHVYVCLYIHI